MAFAVSTIAVASARDSGSCRVEDGARRSGVARRVAEVQQQRDCDAQYDENGDQPPVLSKDAADDFVQFHGPVLAS